LACFKVHKESQCNPTPAPSLPAPSTGSESHSSATNDITDTTNAAPQLSSLSISIPTTTSTEPEEPGPRVKVAKRLHPDINLDETELSADQLNKLAESPELVQLLQNTRLQAQISAILQADDPELFLTNTLNSTPEFGAFVQTMLQHLGLRDASGASTL
jgi:hypothetical protein